MENSELLQGPQLASLDRIAALLAHQSLSQANLLDATKAEQYEFLQQFGFDYDGAAPILGTSARSLKELVRQSSKRKGRA